ncbi:MAG TPA: Fe-S-containing protein [Terriglobales bacterium]
MLEAFTVTLREGVEAALIVGIVLAYLNKIGRPDLRRVAFIGLSAAFLCSIGIAVLLSRLRFNQDIFEGVVMLVAAVFVVTMVVFMMRTAKKLRGEIEGRLHTLADQGSAFSIFLFVFLMVLREGVETVLVLSAVSLNSTELLSFLGTLAGIALSVVFGVMFVKGSVRINLQRFFRVTTVILFFVAGQLLVSGLHELSENGVLPSSRREMALIGPIVRNDVFFFVTILALAALMILFDLRRRKPAAAIADSRAAQRKAEWTAYRERLWATAVYASSFVFIVLITAQFIYAKSTSSLPPGTEISFVNGSAKIPLADVSDGDLHRYFTEIDGKTIRFLLFKRPDGKVVSVYDACSICGPVGFYKSGQMVVCKNCSAPINPQSVGEPGGCNPIPLKSSTTGDAILISQGDLAHGLEHMKQ